MGTPQPVSRSLAPHKLRPGLAGVLAALLTFTLAVPALAYLLPPEMALKFMREPWKGTEPFRVVAKHAITRPGQPQIQTTAEIDFGPAGNFRFADKAADGSFLIRDTKTAVEVLGGQRVDPVVDLYGFRWLFMPTSPPTGDRLQEIRNRGFVLPDPAVQMIVDRLLVRGLRLTERRITACEDRKIPCYVIGSELAPRHGDPARSELWLDSGTFRPLRWMEVRGTTVIDTRFEASDTTKFNGFPARIRITAPGIEHLLEVQDLIRNPKFAADQFNPAPLLDKYPKRDEPKKDEKKTEAACPADAACDALKPADAPKP